MLHLDDVIGFRQAEINMLVQRSAKLCGTLKAYMSHKDDCPVPHQADDALLEDMSGTVAVDGRQRIV